MLFDDLMSATTAPMSLTKYVDEKQTKSGEEKYEHTTPVRGIS